MEENKLPRHGSLVIAVVGKITNFGAYCKLIEYGDIEAFLPIREVSSGWIKNIREYIHDGQKLVCYVHGVDKEKGTIDISLKRVSTKDSKEKIRSYNLEKRLTALFAQTLKREKEAKAKDELHRHDNQGVRHLHQLHGERRSTTRRSSSESKLPKKVKDAFVKALEQNRKQKRYFVSYIATITTYNTESGATELRSLMKEIKETGVELGYIGAPKYRLSQREPTTSMQRQRSTRSRRSSPRTLKKGRLRDREGEAEEGEGGHNGHDSQGLRGEYREGGARCGGKEKGEGGKKTKKKKRRPGTKAENKGKLKVSKSQLELTEMVY